MKDLFLQKKIHTLLKRKDPRPDHHIVLGIPLVKPFRNVLMPVVNPVLRFSENSHTTIDHTVVRITPHNLPPVFPHWNRHTSHRHKISLQRN